jgi:single-strand selective monofunctional uracil DNA glycosylase
VIGIGGFAEGRAKQALAGEPVEFGRILHPSPANPQANRGWSEAVSQNFADMGIVLP